MNTDTDLIKNLNTAPNEAMEKLVSEYTALVWHIAAKYLLNTEDIKECVNDTFAEVYEHRAEYDETKGSLAVWIGTIAKHRAISMYRKLRKTDAQNMEDVADETDRITEAEESIDIEEAISKLSDTDREIIRMKYYEGMSISEIAETLNITYDTARKRHKRSVMNLKKLLVLTLAILALLALVACGIVMVYRHFRVLPGYGITTEEDSASFILPEPVTVQQDKVTVELIKAALYGDTLTCEYTVSIPEPEGEVFLENGAASFEHADGSVLDIQYFEGKDTPFLKNNKYSVVLKDNEIRQLKGKDNFELLLCLHSVEYGGVEQEEIVLPFTLVRTTADELGEYAYLYDEELGGIMVDSTLEGDTLSLNVYPLAGNEMEYYARLTEDPDQEIEGDVPVTILDKDGKVYTAEPFERYIGRRQEDMVTYTFKGITPGKYTLSLPYVYLLSKAENLPSLWLNLKDNTFEPEPVTIPGGTLAVKEIREIEPEPIEKEIGMYERKWEITLHCERTDDTKKLVQIPFELTTKWKPLGAIRYMIRGEATGGSTGGFLTVDEESGDSVIVFGLNLDGLKDKNLSQVEIKLSEGMHPEHQCFRYEKQVELEFEVE